MAKNSSCRCELETTSLRKDDEEEKVEKGEENLLSSNF